MKFVYREDIIGRRKFDATVVVRKICEIEGEDAINARTTRSRFRRFNSGAFVAVGTKIPRQNSDVLLQAVIAYPKRFHLAAADKAVGGVGALWISQSFITRSRHRINEACAASRGEEGLRHFTPASILQIEQLPPLGSSGAGRGSLATVVTNAVTVSLSKLDV
ncbi:hypothetical protein EVAR_21597_1 [Eumeta japonica]|uniref:Mos1 transposase HTH domain-containing protein n=1 Tax=Eumeta variegata TaxID=151549 RepID=A0A4C1UY07_EUMVA|nr:hypothetical protein EVAR_21597_1 [Eumeta japonica]